MELYILNALLQKDIIVERYESLIWTERFADDGDFELHVLSTPENRKLFISGARLAMNKSYRVMEIDTIENSRNADGQRMLKITGASLERILSDRLAKQTLQDTTANPTWTVTGTPIEIAMKVFTDICVTGTLRVADRIPFIQTGSLFSPGTIAAPTLVQTLPLDPQPVHDLVTAICAAYTLGYRLVRNFETSQLYFDVYTGNDRTTAQTTLSPVVFAPELDNLQDTTELKSVAGSKNVAYVFSPQGFQEVYPLGVDPSVSGFDRRVLLVQADPLEGDPTPELIAAYLRQRGKEELDQARGIVAFDGEITKSSNYQYGIDYDLGDLVEIRNEDGYTNNMRVSEQIFVSDVNGERSYPTLALSLLITPGSWLSWDYNQVWSDLGTEEFWSNAP